MDKVTDSDSVDAGSIPAQSAKGGLVWKNKNIVRFIMQNYFC